MTPSRLLTLIAMLCASIAAAAEPTYDRLRAARPDGRKVPVDNLKIERDAYRFTFRSGAFHLLEPVGDTTFAAVFLGDGSFNLVPATENERRHLSVVLADQTAETLTDTFDSLVVFFTDETLKELEAHAAIETGDPHLPAMTRYGDYLTAQKKEYQINIHLRVLLDLLNRPGATDGLFVAAVDGKTLAPALLAYDPLGAGNLAAGFGFLGGEETMFLSLDDENGGFWYLSARRPDAVNGEGKPLTPIVDALHYDIDTTIASNLEVEGTTTIRVRPALPGVRVVPIHIMPKLRLEAATVSVGGVTSPAEIVQEDSELGRVARMFRSEVSDSNAAIITSAPLPHDQDAEITLRYKGTDVLASFGPDSYSVRARESWYPNVGTFTDLATYTIAYRYPKRKSLVSAGVLESETEDEKQTVARWSAKQPVRVVGFNYGSFVKITENDEPSGLTLDVYTNRDYKKHAKDAMADAQNSARVSSAYFGKAPYPSVAVSQQAEWFFGQSWPSLIYLPGLALTSSTERVAMLGEAAPFALSDINEFAKTVGWHEMAHQWWGHLVGWESYRDQWLSEGFAEFTSALVLEITEGRDKYNDLLDRKRKNMMERGAGARLAGCEAGPVSNGFRVSTKASPGAVSTVVYDKGAWVLHMIRMMLADPTKENPDEAFMAMMHEFVATWEGRNPSTSDFQKILERHMTRPMNAAGNGRMDYFFDQWVHGTDIPKIESDLRIESIDGKRYRLGGTVSQKNVPEDFITMVPLYVDFGKQGMARIGFIRLQGTSPQPVSGELPLPSKPKALLVNAMQDVLVR